MESEHIIPALFLSSGCLTGEAVQAYATGDLPDDQRKEVASHLESCDFCSEAVEGISLFIQDKGEDAYASALHLIEEEVQQRLADKNRIIPAAPGINLRKHRTIWTVVSVAATLILLIGLYGVIRLWVPLKQEMLAENKPVGARDSVVKQQFSEPSPSLLPGEEKKVTAAAREGKTVIKNSPEVVSDDFQPAGADTVFMDHAANAEALAVKSPVTVQESVVAGVMKAQQTAPAPVDATVPLISQDKTMEKDAYQVGEVVVVQSKKAAGREKAGGQVKTEAFDANSGEDVLYTVVEEMPSFPGGQEALTKFLNDHLQYPQQARDSAISGNVFVSFIVDPKGRLGVVEVLKGIGGGCDEEAKRVVGKMPRWIPGRQAGKAVKVKFTLLVKFVLQ